MFKNPFELFHRLVHLGAEFAIQFALLENVVVNVRMLRLDESVELLLVFLQGRNRQLIDKSVSAGEDDQDLFFHWNRLVLSLFQQFHQSAATVELSLGRLIQIRAELGESRHFPILREFQAQGAGHLFHRLDLGVAADPGDRDSDVDGRPHAGIEKVTFQKDLAVGDGNHVGWNICGNVARLGFDDRERGQEPPPRASLIWLRVPANGSEDKKRPPGKPHGRGAVEAIGRVVGRPPHASRDRRRSAARDRRYHERARP